MSSQVDVTVFPDNIKADKSTLRNNFQIISNEITKLQVLTSRPRAMAYDDTQFDAI